ncbi:MAG: dTDP-4-dehydrorhamnose reductase [Afipia felis]|nr:dTDP-4-dehydrorhamnose reductase [Afipia felis]
MTALRILLLGKNGQVGAALRPRLACLGDLSAHDRTTCDLGDVARLRDVIRTARPDLIVNAAAYTAVDKAEAEHDLCHRINAVAPGVLAEEAKAAGAWLVHYSTDYVFDGNKASPYTEDDATAPLNAYGRAKCAGEQAIAVATPDHTILRVSWVYGIAGRNFATTILRLASERDELRVVADQWGTPTSADLIADVTAELAQRFILSDARRGHAARGCFHLAPSGYTSWHRYAIELVREARRQNWPLKLSEDTIVPITTKQYPTVAARPRNSVLDTTKLRHLLSFDTFPWQAPLTDFISQLNRLQQKDIEILK